jgi:polyhydroxyalkanoate synthesis regulator phasin
MAQAPDWKQLIEAGMQFTELRRAQARKIAQDLVAQGQIARDQVASTADQLVDLSRRRTEELSKIVRQEVQRQLGALGLATKEDIERIERRVAAASKSGPVKKEPAKKAPAKKATSARKATKATKDTGGTRRTGTNGAHSA